MENRMRLINPRMRFIYDDQEQSTPAPTPVSVRSARTPRSLRVPLATRFRENNHVMAACAGCLRTHSPFAHLIHPLPNKFENLSQLCKFRSQSRIPIEKTSSSLETKSTTANRIYSPSGLRIESLSSKQCEHSNFPIPKVSNRKSLNSKNRLNQREVVRKLRNSLTSYISQYKNPISEDLMSLMINYSQNRTENNISKKPFKPLHPTLPVSHHQGRYFIPVSEVNMLGILWVHPVELKEQQQNTSVQIEESENEEMNENPYREELPWMSLKIKNHPECAQTINSPKTKPKIDTSENCPDNRAGHSFAQFLFKRRLTNLEREYQVKELYRKPKLTGFMKLSNRSIGNRPQTLAAPLKAYLCSDKSAALVDNQKAKSSGPVPRRGPFGIGLQTSANYRKPQRMFLY